MSYLIPEHTTETCYEIKKSRFIARLALATSREQAMTALAEAKQHYPDARHHCWAYQIGSPHSPHLVAMSDDGEPSGTAGKPILNVMQHKPVGNTMLIVTRYFGGIKLGAGGLVRAYSQAAQQAYEHADLVEFRELDTLTLLCDYSNEQWARHQTELHEGRVQEAKYGCQVELKIALPKEQINALAATLAQNNCLIKSA